MQNYAKINTKKVLFPKICMFYVVISTKRFFQYITKSAEDTALIFAKKSEARY